MQDYLDIKNKIIGAFDKAIENGDWESSLFFKTLGKRLKEIRESVARELNFVDEMVNSHSIEAPKHLIKEGYTKVYISVYQADGNNLEKWRNAIKALTEYSITRPIYRHEEDIKAMIRTKADIMREGYAVIYVKDSDILKPHQGKPAEDRFGHELLTLKESAVKPENIVEFVHAGKRYDFNNEALVLKHE